MKIAFDVDGTLIDHNDKPRSEIINLLRSLQAALPQADIFIMSGGGEGYARTIADRIGLSDIKTYSKMDFYKVCPIDIFFDDCNIDDAIAKVWVQV